MARKKTHKTKQQSVSLKDYNGLLSDVVELVEQSRCQVIRTANVIMTATYWEIGRRIVEFEQRGRKRARYGEELLKRLSSDLITHFKRGYGVDNLQRMRVFYLCYPPEKIYATLSRKSQGRELQPEKSATASRNSNLPILVKSHTVSGKSLSYDLRIISKCFPLPWSAYVRLLSIKNDYARAFYEEEALRGGWSVRQLDRQINSMFYERTALSRNKAAMLKKGARAKPEDFVSPEEEIKDPYILEFLGLKDEYSENEMEEALIRHLENFLLELGGDFSFIGRQRRLRIGDEWYRIDLIFFHRRLRCLLIIDLKIKKFTAADAGQMHMYLNYAREHWTHPDENPPVGLILCARKNEAVAKYALEGLPNKVLAAEYRTVLPDERLIAGELEKTRKLLEKRKK